MTQAVDYSWARPGAANIAAVGYVGAVRYLGRDTRGRDLGAGELAELHAAGLEVGVVWETVADRAGHGADAGAYDARQADAEADRLGWPDDGVVYAAVDFDAAVGQVHPYLEAFAGELRRTPGVYGHYDVVEAFVRPDGGGLFRFGWQCAAWSGSGEGSGGSLRTGDGSRRRLSRHACLFQHVGYVYPGGEAGGPCDVNDVLAPWGGWHPDRKVADMGWLSTWTPEDRTAMLDEVTERLVGSESFADAVGRAALAYVSGLAKSPPNPKPGTEVATNLGDVVNIVLGIRGGGGSVDVSVIEAALRELPGDVVDELAARLTAGPGDP